MTDKLRVTLQFELDFNPENYPDGEGDPNISGPDPESGLSPITPEQAAALEQEWAEEDVYPLIESFFGTLPDSSDYAVRVEAIQRDD